MAEQVLEQLTAIGCERFYLLGHSMGGMVALHMTMPAPARGAKLIPFATNSDGNLAERFETFAESKTRMQQTGIAEARRTIVATWFRDGADHPQFPLCLECSDNVELKTALLALDAMEQFNLSAEIQNITGRTLIIGAELDRSCAPHRLQAMHKAIPNSRLHIIPDCAHNAYLEDEETFNRLVLEFLGEPA